MTATSAHELVQSHDCTFPGCPSEAESGSDRCRRHQHTGAGPKREPKREPTRASPRVWTRDEIVDALVLFHRRNGRWPQSAEWQASEARRGAEYPNYDRVVACFSGNFRAAITAASAALPEQGPELAPEPAVLAGLTDLRGEAERLRRAADALDKIAAAVDELLAATTR